ncbi:hypothetical protein GE061_003027 [Apolygus lucorum]|uniref:CCHC-type domain-containing protein n=1 Tax=Apolygus lucorum TaxID=248454 RepID=A0A8S9X2M6_APOLU|nr:hypothetical protein GE061_003027 [Apolygus lucorum]
MSNRRQAARRTISTRQHAMVDEGEISTVVSNDQDPSINADRSSIQQQLEEFKERISQLERENMELRQFILAQPVPSTSTTPLFEANVSESLLEVQQQITSLRQKPISHEGSLMVYEGKTSWEDYAGHLDIVAAANGWSIERKGQKLASALRGSALGVVLAMVPPEERMDFISLSSVLKLRFGQQHLSLKWQSELQSKAQRPRESLAEYAMDIERIVRLATPDWPERCRDEVALHAFLRGLRDQEAKKILSCYAPKTLQDALTRAQLMEGQSYGRDLSISEPECWGCNQKGHLRSNCPSNKKTGESGN